MYLKQKKVASHIFSKRMGRKSSKGSEKSDGSDDFSILPDFNSLSVRTLRKYKKFYNLHISTNTQKTVLAKEVTKHFPKIDTTNEKEIIGYFIHFVKQNETHEIDEE